MILKNFILNDHFKYLLDINFIFEENTDDNEYGIRIKTVTGIFDSCLKHIEVFKVSCIRCHPCDQVCSVDCIGSELFFNSR